MHRSSSNQQGQQLRCHAAAAAPPPPPPTPPTPQPPPQPTPHPPTHHHHHHTRCRTCDNRVASAHVGGARLQRAVHQAACLIPGAPPLQRRRQVLGSCRVVGVLEALQSVNAQTRRGWYRQVASQAAAYSAAHVGTAYFPSPHRHLHPTRHHALPPVLTPRRQGWPAAASQPLPRCLAPAASPPADRGAARSRASRPRPARQSGRRRQAGRQAGSRGRHGTCVSVQAPLPAAHRTSEMKHRHAAPPQHAQQGGGTCDSMISSECSISCTARACCPCCQRTSARWFMVLEVSLRTDGGRAGMTVEARSGRVSATWGGRAGGRVASGSPARLLAPPTASPWISSIKCNATKQRTCAPCQALQASFSVLARSTRRRGPAVITGGGDSVGRGCTGMQRRHAAAAGSGTPRHGMAWHPTTHGGGASAGCTWRRMK